MQRSAGTFPQDSGSTMGSIGDPAATARLVVEKSCWLTPCYCFGTCIMARRKHCCLIVEGAHGFVDECALHGKQRKSRRQGQGTHAGHLFIQLGTCPCRSSHTEVTKGWFRFWFNSEFCRNLNLTSRAWVEIVRTRALSHDHELLQVSTAGGADSIQTRT